MSSTKEDVKSAFAIDFNTVDFGKLSVVARQNNLKELTKGILSLVAVFAYFDGCLLLFMSRAKIKIQKARTVFCIFLDNRLQGDCFIPLEFNRYREATLAIERCPLLMCW